VQRDVRDDRDAGTTETGPAPTAAEGNMNTKQKGTRAEHRAKALRCTCGLFGLRWCHGYP
jgi:hypothetical protein